MPESWNIMSGAEQVLKSLLEMHRLRLVKNGSLIEAVTPVMKTSIVKKDGKADVSIMLIGAKGERKGGRHFNELPKASP